MTRAVSLATPLRAAALAALVLGGLSACAPVQTGATYDAVALGRTASISYGTIVGTRPVAVRGGTSGLGTAGGAVAGGVAGSFIGGDWRSNLLAGLGGAVIGGLAGGAIEQSATGGQAVEFVVREDGGGDFAVVQTNEQGLQVGDRVVVSRGDRTRLSRAAGGPALGFAPPPAGPALGYVSDGRPIHGHSIHAQPLGQPGPVWR